MVSEDAFALCEAVAQRLPGEWSETKTAALGQGHRDTRGNECERWLVRDVVSGTVGTDLSVER